jgi:hypothetical protein
VLVQALDLLLAHLFDKFYFNLFYQLTI